MFSNYCITFVDPKIIIFNNFFFIGMDFSGYFQLKTWQFVKAHTYKKINNLQALIIWNFVLLLRKAFIERSEVSGHIYFAASNFRKAQIVWCFEWGAYCMNMNFSENDIICPNLRSKLLKLKLTSAFLTKAIIKGSSNSLALCFNQMTKSCALCLCICWQMFGTLWCWSLGDKVGDSRHAVRSVT